MSLALTTVPYKLKINLACTLIIYMNGSYCQNCTHLLKIPFPRYENSSFSYLEKPLARLSKMDKLLSTGERW